MPYTIKTQQIAIKDPDTGEYSGVDILTEQTTEGLLNEIEVLGTNKKTAITNEGTTQVTNVQNAGNIKVSEISSLAATKRREIIDAGSEQVAAINVKGQQVLASIPNDYTDLVKTVKSIAHGGFIYGVSSGNVAEFDDGADEMLIKSLVVNIEPQQDLHGYENPWAGGRKNILPYDKGIVTLNGITYTPQADGGLMVSGTMTNDLSSYSFYQDGDILNLSAGETYRFLLNSNSSTGISIQLYVNGTSQKQGKNFTYTIPSGATSARVRLRVSGTTGETTFDEVVYPMVLLASNTDTSWEPCSNICPPSGWTGLTVTRTGKNLFDEANATWVHGKVISADGSISDSSAYRYLLNYLKVSAGSVLTFSYDKATTGSVDLSVAFYDINKKFKERQTAISSTSETGRMHGTVTVPSDATYCRFSCPVSTMNTNFQIEVGATDGTYIPYTGTPISVDWQSTAGTVYGCTHDVASGELTVTRIGHVFDGTETFTTQGSGSSQFYRYIISGKRKDNNQLNTYNCSHFANVLVTTSNADKGVYVYTSGSDNNIRVQFRPGIDTVTDVDSWKAYLAEQHANGTPVVITTDIAAESYDSYQLTPHEVTTFLGTNNVWADTGNVTVTYPVDTKTYIDKKIQEAIDGLSGS